MFYSMKKRIMARQAPAQKSHHGNGSFLQEGRRVYLGADARSSHGLETGSSAVAARSLTVAQQQTPTH